MPLPKCLGVSDYARRMADTRPTFAINLDRLITGREDITARSIASAVGIGDTEISRIRRGQRTPSIELAARIARAAGVSLDSLAYPHDERSTEAAARALAESLESGQDTPLPTDLAGRRRATRKAGKRPPRA